MDDTLEDYLEALCEVFQDDLERQEDMLALCKAQGQAALAHDVEMIEARTEALSILIADAADSEKRRIALAAALVEGLRLPPEKQTLSALIELAPQPWKQRMTDFQKRMRELLEQTRDIVRSNGQVLRRSAKVVGEALDALTQCAPAARGQYDARGESGAHGTPPAFLDQRG